MSSPPPTKPLWRASNILVLVGVLFLFVGVGVFFAIYERFRADLPSAARLEDWQPNLITRVLAADGEVIAEFASERREVIPLQRVPPGFIEAILATEDRTFFEHDGINLRRIFGATWHNIVTGSKSQGASTITMQLSRNLFLTPEKRFVRKFREMILTHEIEQYYPKEKILEMYVNQVYFGSGAYGIESAAQLYFGKPATELDLSESALLAGIIQAPSRQSPRVDMEAALARRAAVLGNLVDVGAIDRETAAEANAAPIDLVPRQGMEGADTYFGEYVRRQLEQMLGTEAVWQGGYRVYTTLDMAMQEVAAELVESHLLEIEKTLAGSKVRRSAWLETQAERAAETGALTEDETEFTTATPYLQGILVAIDLQTGGIVAMVGGRSFQESKFNRVTQARRQPGSVFKPFVYTAAIRSGFPASYVVQDEPFSMVAGDGELWEPKNFDMEFRGPVNLRHALTNSINVPTVRLIFDVGVQAVVEFARDAGLSTDLPPFGSLALGAGDVIPIEILRAYTVFATGGLRVNPISIVRIEDRNGNVIRTFETTRTRVLSDQEAFIMNSILRDVVDFGTGRYGTRGRGFEWPAGGKTGTTNDSTDAWFVGFTPRYAGLTWVGFDLKQRIKYNGTGGLLAAPIWGDFMNFAHADLEMPEQGFPEPEGLERVEVTTTTGMLAAGFCNMPSYTEIMIPGTEPEHYCVPPQDSDPFAPQPGEAQAAPVEQDQPEVDEDFLF